MSFHLIDTHRDQLYFEVADWSLDQRALESIPLVHLTEEARLFERKWFDYRHLHPARATALFAECYRQAHAQTMAKRIDYREAPYRTGMKVGRIFEQSSQVLRGLWKARQHADELCCRYDLFCRVALSFAENRGWVNLPRPTQLYSDDILQAVVKACVDDHSIRLAVPQAPWFRGAEAVSPHVHALHTHLLRQIDARPAQVRDLVLASAMVEGALPKHVARLRYGLAVTDKAERFIASTIK